jgi:hypothetical protein
MPSLAWSIWPLTIRSWPGGSSWSPTSSRTEPVESENHQSLPWSGRITFPLSVTDPTDGRDLGRIGVDADDSGAKYEGCDEDGDFLHISMTACCCAPAKAWFFLDQKTKAFRSTRDRRRHEQHSVPHPPFGEGACPAHLCEDLMSVRKQVF